MKFIQLLSRIFVGAVFVFSGFVKAVDPLGSTYKFIDYFNAFHLGAFTDIALPLAILLSSAELLIGFALLSGFRLRLVSWLLILFMAFFTLLTFILALYNPVSDCGCFGDALILTNWQTFAKNIVLLVPSLVIFFNRNKLNKPQSALREYLILSAFFVVTVLFSVWNYRHIPLIDFRPYRIGVNIPESMAYPADAAPDVYDTRLIYRNRQTGKEEEFTMENFPTDTSLWDFVDAVSEIVSKGYEPPIHNFSITAPNGTDITNDVLSDPGYIFMLVAYSLPKANEKALEDAAYFYELSRVFPEIGFVALTASTTEQILELRNKLSLPYEFCLTDETTLKTIVRSNPGLLLLKNGNIIGKWGFRDFPKEHDLPALSAVLKDYPLCVSCNLPGISTPPSGSKPYSYHTALFYKNTLTDSVAEFSIDNFPHDQPEWVFLKSVSTKRSEGFVSPLEPLVITSPYGMDYTDIVLKAAGRSMVVFFKDTDNLSSETWQAVNKLTGLAASNLGYGVNLYGLLPLSPDKVLQFAETHVSAIEFLSVPEEAINLVDFTEVFMCFIDNGTITAVWRDNGLPQVENLAAEIASGSSGIITDSEILPFITGQFIATIESTRIYLLIILLILFLYAVTRNGEKNYSAGR
jgi:uncharacterized membrane protein YphA (DoxX/SURF4 family)